MAITAQQGAQPHRRKTWTLAEALRALAGRQDIQFPLVLPHVPPLAGPLIIWRLKRSGYSNCRVVRKSTGLHIYADR